MEDDSRTKKDTRTRRDRIVDELGSLGCVIVLVILVGIFFLGFHDVLRMLGWAS